MEAVIKRMEEELDRIDKDIIENEKSLKETKDTATGLRVKIKELKESMESKKIDRSGWGN